MFQKEKLGKAIEALKEYEIDMWLTVTRESMMNTEPVLPLILTGDVVGTSAFIVTKDGDKVALVNTLDVEGLRRQGIYDEVVGYMADNPYRAQFIKLIDRFTPKTIAMNYSEFDVASDGLSHGLYMQHMGIFREMDFRGEIVSSQKIMSAIRGFKTEEEIQRMINTIGYAEKIYAAAKGYIAEGKSELDLQRFFQKNSEKLGASYSWEKSYNPIVMVGTETVVGHTGPNPSIKVKKGDVINIDFGLRIEGYSSDQQRVYYVLKDGETAPPADVQKAFDTVQESIRRVIAAMKPGVLSGDLVKLVQDCYEENGFRKWEAGLGHQIGILAHDGGIGLGSKSINPELDYTLKEGMVFTVEPSIVTSRGCIGQEEMVAVTKDGGRLLTQPQKEIWLV